MRVFRKVDRRPWGPPYHRWLLYLPDRLARELGWEHRDDITLAVVDGELRARKTGPRDRNRDRVPGGRRDPVTQELRPPTDVPMAPEGGPGDPSS